MSALRKRMMSADMTLQILSMTPNDHTFSYHLSTFNNNDDVSKWIIMVALDECDMKYEWWLNELRSLGLEVSRRNEFNDLKEISVLVNNLKESYYTHYQKSPTCSD